MKNPMSKFNLLSDIRFSQKDKKNNREKNHETKILKKMLAITLVCILMVMSMGAYGGDVTQDVEVISFLRNFGLNNSDFQRLNEIDSMDKFHLYDEHGENKVAILYELQDRYDKNIAYAIYDVNINCIVEFALGESPYTEFLPTYLEEFQIATYKLTYGGPTFYGIIEQNQSLARNSGSVIEFVKFSNAKVKQSNIVEPDNNNSKGFNLDGFIDRDTYNTTIRGIGNLYASGGLYCTDVALANILWFWKNVGYTKITSQYSNLSQLAWYFRELNYHHPETGGVENGDVDESMINFVNSYYPGVFSSAFIYTPIDNGHDYIEVHIDDLKRLVNQGYPSILTLVEHPTYDEHAVVVAGYSTYLGNWVYIQDGWTNNQVMILYNTSGQSAARTYHNLNYLYYK